MARYKELTKYKQQFGHCNVPQGSKRNTQLANWVHRQRKLFKSKSLSEERITQLNRIGFTWEMDNDAWKARYDELCEYRREFGDCNVSRTYKANPKLGKWVNGQRMLFKTKSLKKNRIAKLDEIGFTWKIRDAPPRNGWAAFYGELIQYKLEFGDCHVPQGYKANRPLGNWVNGQRKRFKTKTLAQDRLEKLNEIGFVWDRRGAPSNEKSTSASSPPKKRAKRTSKKDDGKKSP
jgi:hypothetical protein